MAGERGESMSELGEAMIRSLMALKRPIDPFARRWLFLAGCGRWAARCDEKKDKVKVVEFHVPRAGMERILVRLSGPWERAEGCCELFDARFRKRRVVGSWGWWSCLAASSQSGSAR